MRSGSEQGSPLKFSPPLSIPKKRYTACTTFDVGGISIYGGWCNHAKIPFAPVQGKMHQSALFCTAAPKNAPLVELIPRFYYYLLCNTKSEVRLNLRFYQYDIGTNTLSSCSVLAIVSLPLPSIHKRYTRLTTSAASVSMIHFFLLSGAFIYP